jgi:hypothetical protein
MHMSCNEEVKMVKDWWQISMLQAYRNSSHDMISAPIFKRII